MMCSDIRGTLCSDIESELKKNADSIDTDYIDRRIDELCKQEARRSGLRSPEATEAQINTVINRITARVRRRTPTKRLHPLIRIAAVACIVLVFSLLIFNYLFVRKTNHCLPNEMKITLCCGTGYCPCNLKN